MIFTYVVYTVSGGRGILNNSITVQAEFEDVEGLLVGNNVRYSGVKVGTVNDIKVVSDKVLMITMSLDMDVTNYMKSNAEADIGTNGLVGNMLVNIKPGKGDAPLIKDNDIIHVKQSVELSEMMNTMSSTNDKISQITDALLQITEKINNGSGSISQLINDGSIVENLKMTTRSLSLASNKIYESTDSINSMILNVSEGRGNLGYLFNDESIKTQVSELSNSLDSLINDSAQPIMKNLEKSSEAIANTSKELESLIGKLEKNEGLLGAMLNDTTVSQDLKSTIDNLNRGTQKFDESMEALQHHWLLRGFFKKKEKEAKKAEKKKKDEMAKIESK